MCLSVCLFLISRLQVVCLQAWNTIMSRSLAFRRVGLCLVRLCVWLSVCVFVFDLMLPGGSSRVLVLDDIIIQYNTHTKNAVCVCEVCVFVLFLYLCIQHLTRESLAVDPTVKRKAFRLDRRIPAANQASTADFRFVFICALF